MGVVPGSPSGMLNSWNKTYNWTGVGGATNYILELQTLAGAPVASDWFSASAYCAGTTCSALPSWWPALANGDYRWRIRDYSTSTGYGVYTAWQEFTLNLPTVVLGSPSGTVSGWDKSFNWTGISGPTNYILEVQTSAGVSVYSGWFAASGYCTGVTCKATPAGLSLAAGDYRWRIREYSTSYGYGLYTAWQNFSISAGVVLGNPSGTLTSWDRSYNWTGVVGVTNYIIEVQTSAGVPVSSGWFTASAYCSGTTCKAYPGWWAPLVNGDYRWRIREYTIGAGYGPYTAWQNFTLNLPSVTLGSPLGILTSWDKSFHWTGISDVDYYIIEVQTSAGASVTTRWYGTTVCSGTTCTVIMADLSLPNGDYRWRIRTYSNKAGYGFYTDWQNFTLNLP